MLNLLDWLIVLRRLRVGRLEPFMSQNTPARGRGHCQWPGGLLLHELKRIFTRAPGGGHPTPICCISVTGGLGREDCVIFTSDFPKDPPPIWIFKLEISISESLNERGCLVTHYSNENIFMRSNRTGSCIPGAGTVGRMLIIRQDGT